MKSYSISSDLPLDVENELKEFPELVRRLLYNRGISKIDDAKIFLNPDYERDLHDPFLILDMEKAVQRILRAIQNDEKIIIYGDYDADGIPGSVVLHDFFKKINYSNFENYIPHRYREGYSLNHGAIEKFAEGGVTLVVTVDSGITDVEEVKKANELGVDIIITDHHLPLVGEDGQQIIPPAYAVLNSKQDNCDYHFDMLCGAGTAFKLVQALIKKGEFNIAKGWEKWLLDVVGISTIADMVPLKGENRALAYYGLKVLRKSPRPGLIKLLKKTGVKQRFLTEEDVGFTIAPRINAASRMGEPIDAFRLLSTEDEVLAGQLSDDLDHLNNKRKGLVASIIKEARKKLEAKEEVREVIVMGNTLWMPGLLGLAANKLMEEYGRPVFMWGKEGGEIIKGSCRSNGGVNVVDLMSSTPANTFLELGGHESAGGFSVSSEKIHILEDMLVEAYKKLEQKSHDRKIPVDKKMNLDEVNIGTYGLIESLAPYGIENPKPIFLFEGIEIAQVLHFGKEKNHLKLVFKNSSGYSVPAIGFFMTSDDHERIKEGNSINLVASMEKSTFGRTNEIRLRIVDMI